MKKHIIYLLFLLLVSTKVLAQKKYYPKEGDILFQDLDCGDFCDAIEKVTEGIGGKDFSHMGILSKNNKNEWIVYESRAKGVQTTPLKTFLNLSLDQKGSPKILVARVKDKFKNLIPKAILFIKSLLNKPYDPVFDFSNDRYYCSEMIHFAFKKANQEKDFFRARPMTFVDPDTKKVFPVWQTHFEELGVAIPEGKIGINPGGMSKSKKLQIIYDYTTQSKFER